MATVKGTLNYDLSLCFASLHECDSCICGRRQLGNGRVLTETVDSDVCGWVGIHSGTPGWKIKASLQRVRKKTRHIIDSDNRMAVDPSFV